MRKLLLTLILVVLGTGLFAQTYRSTSDKGLNLRSEPNANASVLTSIPAGADIVVVDKSNSEWYKVRYGGKTGYVSARHISEKKSEQAQASNNGRTSTDRAKNNDRNNNGRSSSNKSNSGSSNNKSNSSSGGSSEYNTGIGLRFGGWETGLTVKHFIKDGAAIEGILSSGWMYRGTRITGLYEWQKLISGANGLYWFVGVGAHVGFYNERYWYKGDCKDGEYEYKGVRYNCDGTRAVIGIDGIIGLEYKFQELPFTIGLDLKPSIDLFGLGHHYGDGAFSVRYVF